MKLNKKILTASIAVITASMSFSPLAFAAPNTSATGAVQYSQSNGNNAATFDVSQTSKDCTDSYNVSNEQTLTAVYNGNDYTYSVDLTQTGNSITGTLDDPYYPTTQPITGTISGDTITLVFSYPGGSVQGTRTYTGTINQSGAIVDSSWSETGTEDGTGTWYFGSDVTVTKSCTGSGQGNFTNAGPNNTYIGNVTCVAINGNTAVFSGPLVQPLNSTYKWFIAEVVGSNTPNTGKISANVTTSDPKCNTSDLTQGLSTVTGIITIH